MKDRLPNFIPRLSDRKSYSLTATAGVAALGGLLFGYDTSVISGAMLFLREDFKMNDAQLEFAVSVALGGALLYSRLPHSAPGRTPMMSGVRKQTGSMLSLYGIKTGVNFGIRASSETRP